MLRVHRWQEPVLFPADGATGIPCAFGARQEIPNPLPGSRGGLGCGMPIYCFAIGALDQKELTAAELRPLSGDGKPGAPLRGSRSCPQRPANPEWPSNSGIALFLPAKPLAAGTRYQVSFTFAGRAEPVTWTFTTVP